MFEWMNDLKDFFNDNLILRVVLDSYFTLIIVAILVFLCFKFRKAFVLTLIGLIIGLIFWFANTAELTIAKSLYGPVLGSYIVISAIILAPELRRLSEQHSSAGTSNKSNFTFSNEDTINAIADAVFDMSAVKVGALITLEQHNSLEQYSEKAITLNSDISKELLEQIFIKDSPLHDGGVIIRGNKIVCAAAYYTLTQNTSLDKTVGSRHRAAVGISEMTDSFTIVVSEETGHVHAVVTGFMREISSKPELIDYIATYLGEKRR